MPNFAKVKMDSEGNLTVSFDKPVNYPRYIINSFNGTIKREINLTSLEMTKKRSLTSKAFFFNSNLQPFTMNPSNYKLNWEFSTGENCYLNTV